MKAAVLPTTIEAVTGETVMVVNTGVCRGVLVCVEIGAVSGEVGGDGVKGYEMEEGCQEK